MTTNNKTDNKNKEFKTNRRLRATEYYDMQDCLDKLYRDSKDGKKFTNLMDIISSRNNILLAYRNIKSNTGGKTPGVDNITIDDLKDNEVEDIILKTQRKLENYFPKAVERVYIPKANGKTRPLGIPTIEDRLVQQAIKQVLDPICEAKFHSYSFGFRPNRRAEHAIAYFMRLANLTKCHYVVDIDIKGFFDNVNHSKLLKQCWTLGIRDKNLLSVLKKCLTAPIVEEVNGETIITKPTKGTPQGGILSPLLSNIVLNELDWWVSNQWQTKHTIREYPPHRSSDKYKHLRISNLKQGFIVRYADDFKIMCKSKEDAIKWYHAVRLWLKERLDLEISPDKSKITNLKKSSSEFLGFRFKLKNKGNKWVIHSWMTQKAKQTALKDFRKSFKSIQRMPINKSAELHNAKVLGRQQYYQIATHVNLDMQEIQYKLLKTAENRLKRCSTITGTKSETYNKFYKGYRYKTYFINGTALFPIAGIKHRNPKLFNQNKTPYTKEGRDEIHKNLECVSPKDLQYIINNPVRGMSIEYNDNRVSLFTAQWGMCAITGEPLSPVNMECHHKKPRSLGGTDEWKNLMLVTPIVHKLIHATKEETISKLLGNIYFASKEHETDCLKKINKYRKIVGNNKIDYMK